MRLRELVIRPGWSWETTRRELDVFFRDLVQILNGGIKLRDQFRIVRDVTLNTDHIPFDVGVPTNTGVLGVVLVGARRQSDGRVFSGGPVEWSTPLPAVVRIHSMSALAPSTVYEITLAMVE